MQLVVEVRRAVGRVVALAEVREVAAEDAAQAGSWRELRTAALSLGQAANVYSARGGPELQGRPRGMAYAGAGVQGSPCCLLGVEEGGSRRHRDREPRREPGDRLGGDGRDGDDAGLGRPELREDARRLVAAVGSVEVDPRPVRGASVAERKAGVAVHPDQSPFLEDERAHPTPRHGG